MLDLMSGFVVELRNAGLPVSLTENLDAMEAITHIPIEDRDAFKYALAATLVKNEQHWKAFETVFEVYFSLRGPEYSVGDEDGDGEWDEDDLEEWMRQMMQQQQGQGGPGSGEDMSPEEIAEMLFKALMDANEAMMQAMARAAVTQFAGMEPGRPVGGTYYLYRTLRNLDLDGMLDRLMEESMDRLENEPTQLQERLQREEFENRIEQLKREIEAEIRRRLVADRWVESMAKTLRKRLPDDVDFIHS